MIGRLVKIKGMNRRMLAIDRLNVLFLEEHELDGLLVTNIHFMNGKWVTSGLPLDEAEALIYSASIEKHVEDEQEKSRLEKWKRNAIERAKIQKEVDELVRSVGPKVKHKSYEKQEFPDGSGKLTIFYEPITDGEET